MIYILLGLISLQIITLVIFYYLLKKKTEPVTISNSIDFKPLLDQMNINNKELSTNLYRLPDNLLQAITGSSNTHKGKLGELVGYISLKAEFDRVMPIGSIVDFICIKLPQGNDPGKLCFIDIKTGKNARLTTEQKGLKQLIEQNRIEFRKLDIDSIDVMGVKDDTGTSTDRKSEGLFKVS